MKAKKLCYIHFYPNDWLSDERVRSVSPAARGLWIDLLCIMHKNDPRGYLQRADGAPYSTEQISSMTGICHDFAIGLLSELLSSGVASQTDEGVIFNRRMVREGDLSEKRAIAGTIGSQKRWQNDSKQHGKTIATADSDNDSDNTNDCDNRGRGKEGGAGGEKESPVPVPVSEIMALYNECCPSLRHAEKLSPEREKHIRERWRDGLGTLEDWRSYFERVERSDFLTLRIRSDNPRGQTFKGADLDWTLNPNNYAKIIEGKYDKGAEPKRAPGEQLWR